MHSSQKTRLQRAFLDELGPSYDVYREGLGAPFLGFHFRALSSFYTASGLTTSCLNNILYAVRQYKEDDQFPKTLSGPCTDRLATFWRFCMVISMATGSTSTSRMVGT